ncbi:MAG: malate dehydrogenase (quinone) [Pontiellaceae bacterium]|nr:malate dehydrogenase (quinone) [Pontiellaceae bacterium]MBN2786642.1 malate dehydrogenase (quinone) [Pontiellaceae bacterium]
MKNDHLYGIEAGEIDVALIGGGIMSATLGVLLRRLKPDWTIQIIETLPQVALESSNAWNNAGTGHAGLCELNYTSESADGGVNISKALKVNSSFEISKQFWAWLTKQGIVDDPSRFIRSVAHMSFVTGKDDCDFLRRRKAAMVQSPAFEGMEFSDDPARIAEWAPLLMDGRFGSEPVAATHNTRGTDVNYGEITRILIDHLTTQDGVGLITDTRVNNLSRLADGRWKLSIRHATGGRDALKARFVFIGAGGGALPLLQKSGIPEGKGFGGFPVSGQFLVCRSRAVAERHHAKVYGKAKVGAPPMSVPHLDSRVINGQRTLLFGPYAGFSPKFLKKGTNLDLIKSVTLDNVIPMLATGRDNMDLTKYLINECRKNHETRCAGLREFVPTAKNEDWALCIAGQRVQIIKKDPKKGGKLQFGTEVVAAADGSISAMLGASPGASTAPAIMLDLLEKCFPQEMKSDEWRGRLTEMIPSYGLSLDDQPALFQEYRAAAHEVLGLIH